MRRPAWLWFSLGLNLVLVGAVWWQLRQPGATPAPAPSAPRVLVRTQHVILPPRILATNVFLPKPDFKWRQIESEDYFQYVANLRAIGCPEQTIRDIIIADVNHLYARKRAALIKTEYDLWWKSEPDMDNLAQSVAVMQKLEIERRTLLSALLGPHWEDDPTRPRSTEDDGLKFTGQVLSELPATTVHGVRAAWEKYQRDLVAHQQERKAAGQPPDFMVMAHLQREYREQLERLLTAPQLEEFLLRNSPTAEHARENLVGFNTTPEEFRAVFRALDNAQRQLMLATVTTPEAYAEQQKKLQKLAEAEIERALGKERFREYQFNMDPVFREVRDLAEEHGAPPEAVLPIYEIRQASASEEAAIRNNPNLTLDEQTAALQTMREQREAALRKLMGDEAYERYVKAQADERK